MRQFRVESIYIRRRSEVMRSITIVFAEIVKNVSISPSLMTLIEISYIFNIINVDDLSTPGTRSYTRMV